MEPGREVDALIAEKVMGLEEVHFNDGQAYTELERECLPPPSNKWMYLAKDGPNDEGYYREIPSYSTSLAAAWKVVFHVGAAMQLFLYTTGLWEVNFHIRDKVFNAEAPTAPLAICHAALKAIE